MENIREGADRSSDKPHPGGSAGVETTNPRLPPLALGVPDWIAIIDSWKIPSTYSAASRIFSTSYAFLSTPPLQLRPHFERSR